MQDISDNFHIYFSVDTGVTQWFIDYITFSEKENTGK